jgi:hypothetical protein
MKKKVVDQTKNNFETGNGKNLFALINMGYYQIAI